MKKIYALLLPALFLITSALHAQKLSPTQQAQVNEAFKNSKTARFKFRVSSMQEVAPLAKIISIEKNQGSEIYAHVTKAQFSQFITKAYPYTLIKNPKPATKVKLKAPAKKK
ncbi:MAG: hypothetical protein K0Q95_2132 [Bacteroidota bacterium]|jgi:hypothetical protein|nr:hypothetical protein [Bacteroidota bacterium]